MQQAMAFQHIVILVAMNPSELPEALGLSQANCCGMHATASKIGHQSEEYRTFCRVYNPRKLSWLPIHPAKPFR